MTLSNRRALVIEDDDDIRELLRELLSHTGFTVTQASDGVQGLVALAENPDLVTLDLNLPDFDGIEVCRRIRERTDAYILMLTARTDEIDRLVGLETGADDYLTKPFSSREFKARVAALMRRPRTVASAPAGPPVVELDEHEVLRHDGLELDVDARAVSLNGADLVLTRTEFDLLTVLMRGPRRVWGRDILLRTVWGDEWVADGHLVEVHMGNLRRKLGDDARTGRFIRTVRGIGYQLGRGE